MDRWLDELADELIVGRASVQKDRTIVANFISSDDHRELPTVIMSGVEASTGLGVGCAGDVLHVLNAGEGAICAYELNVTVRSDAFRLQRSGNGLIPTQRGRVAGNTRQMTHRNTGCGCLSRVREVSGTVFD